MSQAVPKDLNHVLKAYGWKEPKKVFQNRNKWFIETSEGSFFLKRSPLPTSSFTLVQEMLEKLRWEGYTHVLPLIHTRDGTPFFSDRGQPWYVVPWKQSKGTSVEVEDLILSLAQLHRLSIPFVKDNQEDFTRIDQKWIDQWRKKKEKLYQIKQTVTEKEFPSPFDQNLLRHYHQIEQSLTFAIRGMEKFVAIEDGQSPRYTLCHNRIHPNNLVYDDQTFYWVDFDHVSFNSPVYDLALFIHRFSHLKSPGELLQIYDKECKLDPKERRLLALYLAYPERLLKRIHLYYKGITLSEEPLSQKRFEQEINRMFEIQQLVVQLWPNRKRGKM